jgi:hypothetical protein
VSLCQNMQNDFQYGWGDREPVTGELLYTEYDLRYGRQYALDYLAEGTQREPLRGFDLRRFARWCERKLTARGHLW